MLVSLLHGEVFENGQDKLFSVEEVAFGQPNIQLTNIEMRVMGTKLGKNAKMRPETFATGHKIGENAKL